MAKVAIDQSAATWILKIRGWVCGKTGLTPESQSAYWITFFVCALTIAIFTSLTDAILSMAVGNWAGNLTYIIDIIAALIIIKTLSNN